MLDKKLEFGMGFCLEYLKDDWLEHLKGLCLAVRLDCWMVHLTDDVTVPNLEISLGSVMDYW